MLITDAKGDFLAQIDRNEGKISKEESVMLFGHAASVGMKDFLQDGMLYLFSRCNMMDFFKKQPLELSEDELHQTCFGCNVEMNISMKQSTIFRDKWYHVWCWRKLVKI